MKIAILLVHGILGRPEQFDFLLPLIPSDWTVRNITLIGHGGTPLDFGRASMKKWREQVHSEIMDLKSTHDVLYVVGHSMGTLFALEESLLVPVDALFLLNPPLKVHIPFQLLKLTYSVYMDKIDPDDYKIVAGKNAYGIGPDKNLLHYVRWIPRYLELFAEISATRKILPSVKTPAYAFISLEDEMASPKSAGVFSKLSSIPVTLLPHSTHFYYEEADKEVMKSAFLKEIVNRI